MNNKKVLTNSAILTAIWDETKKDNLELIKPFVEFLIGENYKEGDKIDNNYIINIIIVYGEKNEPKKCYI